jgi:hypothetical protein
VRALIFTAIKAAVGDICGDRVYPSGTLGIGKNPASPEQPYVQYIELPSVAHLEVRRTSRAVDRTFQVWAYDKRGSYARIDNILSLVRETILGLITEVDQESGARCIEVVWEGESQDLHDDEHDENAKYSLFKLTSSS